MGPRTDGLTAVQPPPPGLTYVKVHKRARLSCVAVKLHALVEQLPLGQDGAAHQLESG